jgi:lipopolysaccharide/colanic/teichoic acid biosynthesis glycosyltransferase
MLYNSIFKPVCDFLVAIIGLLVLSPIFLVVMISLALANLGKPFFFQLRPGKDERIFKVIKFKTMNDKRGNDGKLLSDKERLTKVGNFVRKTSLDEIPQLINILKGDMSLIGSRPLLVKYLPLYNNFQKRRHEVKPGITGWAQVNGRNAISWEEKFNLDVWYVDHLSFSLDIKIFFRTIGKIIKSEGITTQGQATTKPFTGSEV